MTRNRSHNVVQQMTMAARAKIEKVASIIVESLRSELSERVS